VCRSFFPLTASARKSRHAVAVADPVGGKIATVPGLRIPRGPVASGRSPPFVMVVPLVPRLVVLASGFIETNLNEDITLIRSTFRALIWLTLSFTATQLNA